MVCPECMVIGEKSVVFVGSSFTTLLGFASYYDEEGRFHSHDPNKTTTTYTCSKGHSFSEQSKSKCPTCKE